MSYAFIENFKAGMDRRAAIDNSPAGSLWTLTNAHLTRGGEIEKRKAFVSTYSLPVGETFGLEATAAKLYTFGSAASPAVPAGVTYQRLQHPDGLAMMKLVSSDIFDGKVYAVAEFSDGSIHHFYDGSRVTEWDQGIVRSAMTNNDGIATHLAALINAADAYTATATGSTITITAAVAGTGYTISSDVEDGGGTDDQAITLTAVQQNVEGVSEVLATGSFRIEASKASAGVNQVTSITVNSVDILGAAVDVSDNAGQTASDIASQINTYASTPDYTATASGDTVTISAAAGTGSNPNGYAVVVNASSGVSLGDGGFAVTGGTASAGVNLISSVKVDGVEVLGASVDWTTSNSATATAVAAQINSNASTPEYIAVAIGPFVHISKAAADSDTNALTVAVTVGGDVTVGSETAVVSSVTDMDGGVDAVAGVAQVYEAAIGGTFEVGDKFTIIIDDTYFGAAFLPAGKGTVALTHKGKLYSTVGSLLQFSAVDAPTKWRVIDDADYAGTGYINMANQAAGSEDLTALQVYQDNLAVFSRRAIQVWYVDADDAVNTPVQTLQNTGTRSPKAVVAFGNRDVFYLDETGIRSIRARDSSNAAYVEDVGTAIDAYVREHIDTLTDDEIEAACGIIESTDGRYWLAIGDKIFVFSYFPASKVSAWSVYEPGFTITDIVDLGRRIYARSGDTIYLYGGDDNATYDSCEVTVQLPFYHAGKPGTYKQIQGIDVSAENTWDFKLLVDPTNLTRYAYAGEVDNFSYNGPDIATVGHVTHVAPQLVCEQPGAARLNNITIHYQTAEQEAK